MTQFLYAGCYGPEQVIDLTGAPIVNTEVIVYAHGTTTPASLYSDRTMDATVVNPTSTDGDGNLTFFTAPGQYDIVCNGATVTVNVIPDPLDLPNTHASTHAAGGTDPLSTQFEPISAVRAITGATVTANPYDVLECNATAQAITVTLPTNAAGVRVTVKKTDSSSNAVTITGTIDGVTNPALTHQYSTYELVADGTNWFRISRVGAGSLVDLSVASNALVFPSGTFSAGITAQRLTAQTLTASGFLGRHDSGHPPNGTYQAYDWSLDVATPGIWVTPGGGTNPTDWVNLVAAAVAGVSTFNTRSGSVVLLLADLEGLFTAANQLPVGTGSGTGELLTGPASDGLYLGRSSGVLAWLTPPYRTLFNPTAKTTTYTAAAWDCIEATGTFTVTLPASPSAGQEVAIENRGSGPITIAYNSGQSINGVAANLTLPAALAGYTAVVLRADSSTAWVVSDAYGTDLGQGFQVAGTLDIVGTLLMTVSAKTTTYTVLGTDSVLTVAAGTYNVTFGTALKVGQIVEIVNVGASGTVTLLAAGSGTIDGAASFVLVSGAAVRCVVTTAGANPVIIVVAQYNPPAGGQGIAASGSPGSPTIGLNGTESVNVVSTGGSAQTLAAVATDIGNDITLSANLTVTMPTPARGAFCYAIVRQAASGGPYTITFSGVKWPGGTAPTMSTSASAFDRYDFVSDGTYWYGIITGQAFH